MAKEKKNTLYTLFGKIGDILFIPIIIFALIVTTMIFFQRENNKAPSLFGISVVRILSGSMIASGFNVGDTVFVTKTDTDLLWEGDIIAFFSYSDSADKYLKKTKLETVDQQIVATMPVPENRVTINDIQGKNYKIVFHQIVGVYYDESGTRYFETKGTSNGSADSTLIREDFVVGKYVNTPNWLRSFAKWLSSAVGMVCCVCIPIGILVILQSLSLIEQINFLYVEKRLIKGEIDWLDREAQRLIKTGDMEEICKIIYYTKVDDDERDEFAETVWRFKGKLSKKERLYRDNLEESFDIFEEKGKKEYFLFWKNHLKWKWDIKQIEQELTYIMYNDEVNKKSESR